MPELGVIGGVRRDGGVRDRLRRHVRDDVRADASRAQAVASRAGSSSRPTSARVHQRPTPNLGGVAMFVRPARRHGRRVAARRVRRRVRVELGAARRDRRAPWSSSSSDSSTSRNRGEVCRRRRSSPAWCSPAACCSLAGVSTIFFRVPVPRRVLADPRPVDVRHRALGRRHGQRDQPHRRPRRTRRRHRRHRGGLVLPVRRTASTTSACSPGNIGPLLVADPCSACASGSCRTTSTRPSIFMGDCGALLLGLLMAASTIVGRRPTDDRVQRPDVLLLRPAVHPARHPRRADPRHRLRHRPPRHATLRRRDGGQGPPPPPAHAPRPRPAPQRAHPLGVDGAAVGLRAVPDAHRAGATPSCRSASPRSALLLYTVFHPGARSPATTATTRDHDDGGRSAGGDGKGDATRPWRRPKPTTRVVRRSRARGRCLHADFVVSADGICTAETVCSRLRKYSQGCTGTPRWTSTQRRELNNGFGEALSRAFELVLTPGDLRRSRLAARPLARHPARLHDPVLPPGPRLRVLEGIRGATAPT